MAHKDKQTRQYRLWLRESTLKQVKLLALVLGRDDWNLVADDMLQLGIAYMNDTAKLELADWQPTMRLVDLRSPDLHLRVIKGDLPLPEGA